MVHGRDISFGRPHDGRTWYYQNDMPIFPPSPDRQAFDARYTSTPHVVKLPGRYLMYYSARDLDDEWIAPDGTTQRDPDGVYRHIGCAELPVTEAEDPGLRFSWSEDGEAIPGEGGALPFVAETAGRRRVTCRAENANGATEYTWDLEVTDG